MANDQKVYLKKQHVTRGKAGYKNLPPNAVVVEDPGRYSRDEAAKSSKKSKESEE